MITDDKVIEIFFIIDEFCKEFEQEMSKQPVLGSDGVRRRNRKANMSHSEIMTILLLYHFGTFRNFKHFYMHFIKVHLAQEFPTAVSYNRFVELEGRVFFHMMFFLNLRAFGSCTGITFVDSTMIPVCHNLRRYANKVFRAWQPTARARWDGATASSCTSCATILAKSSPSCSRVLTLTTVT